MAKIVFKELTSNQNVLFPVSLSEKIAPNHPVRVVNSVVDALDISCLLLAYKGGGTSSYHPRMMLKVLFYAYLNNIYSCRKIERPCRRIFTSCGCPVIVLPISVQSMISVANV